MLQSLSIASAVAVTNALYDIPGIESAPVWRTLAAASNMAGGSRRITPLMAAELANVLGVGWAMTGEIYPSPDGYGLIIDFIPAKASMIPFRYQTSLRPELLEQRLNQALEQFLRYARHPAPQLGSRIRTVNQSELFKLAEEVDREYGWFSAPAPGKAQAAFASLFALDPRLASLLFDPGLYAAAAEPAPAEPSKPAAAVIAEPGVKPALTLPNAINPVPDREPPKQVAPPPPSRAAGVPENSKWVPLMVPPILALPPEQQFRQEQTGADVNRRVTSRPSAFFSGHEGGSDSSALPRAPRARHVLQLFASANEAEARQVAQDLMRAGVPAKVSTVKAGRETLYRVSGGAYDYLDTASAAGDALVALRIVDEYWVRAEALTTAIASRTPPAKAPQASETAGSAAGEFQVQVFASFNREKAVAFAEGLRKIGLQARIEQLKVTGKGDCYRVRLNGYQSRKEAIVAAEQLRAQGRIREYWIVSRIFAGHALFPAVRRPFTLLQRSYAAMKNRLSKALVLGCLLHFLPASGLAQDSEAQKKTLAGLKGFFVVINDVGPDGHSAGISEPALVDQAASGLRNAGIRVATRDEFLTSPDRSLALLGITISSVKNRAGDTCALSCFLQVTQTVMLVRDPAVRAPVATWYAGGTGIAASDVAGAEIKKWLTGLMEHFVDAYRSANPK